jgi:formate dehydrogenase major subunit
MELARRLGLDWDYAHARDVFAEMAQAMPSLANISWDRLEREDSVTYPCAAPDAPGEAIVFRDAFPTPSGRARLVPAGLSDPAEMPDAAYPFVLTTGRELEHWHTGAMTRRASVLDALEPAPTVSLAPAELQRLGIACGQLLRVATRRGAVELMARADPGLPEGLAFIPFAYREAAANLLTDPRLDPDGRIPASSIARRGWSRPDEAAGWRAAQRPQGRAMAMLKAAGGCRLVPAPRGHACRFDAGEVRDGPLLRPAVPR